MENENVKGQLRRETRPAMRDDRILPETRWTLGLVIPFLITAFILLYFWPDRTKELFAWPASPRMIALLMGAGYIGGAYFFLRTLFETKWHRVAIGFLPVAAFAALEGIATLLHWDRFSKGHVSFYAWAGLYMITPFLIFGLWLRNRQTDPGTLDMPDAVIPTWFRAVMGLTGAGLIACGLVFFFFPQVIIPIWAWEQTPLTTRVLGGWFVLPGVFAVLIAFDRRWSSARLALQSQALSLVLILLGAMRAWSDFDPSNPLTWLFVGGLAALLAAILIIYALMENRRNAQAQDSKKGE
jgi:hypothetical protein